MSTITQRKTLKSYLATHKDTLTLEEQSSPAEVALGIAAAVICIAALAWFAWPLL